MAEKEEFLHLIVDWRGAAVLVPTFALTVFKDLTFGIVTGCLLAALFAGIDRARRAGKS
jgi:SulP family sulfate permease